MSRKTEIDLALKVRAYVRAKTAAKKGYDRADRLLKEIASALGGKAGAEIPLSEKSKAVLKDNFAGKDVVWGHGGVRHWELEIEER